MDLVAFTVFHKILIFLVKSEIFLLVGKFHRVWIMNYTIFICFLNFSLSSTSFGEFLWWVRLKWIDQRFSLSFPLKP